MKLTKQGQLLLAKCIAESLELKFTKFAIGDGLLDEDEKIFELTELKHWCMDLPLTNLKVVGNGTAQITAILNNAEVVTGFACREHALYCLDEKGNELLFSYRNLGEYDYDFIASAGGDIIKNIFLTEVVEVRDAENVTAILDLSAAYITQTEFEEHVNSERPHKNAPTKLNDVQTTTEIWAIDYDSHLHKISVENLRDLIADKTEKQSAQDIISAAQNELGLAANILMIEDFADETVSDYFISNVKSAAEHGNLLSIEKPENLRTGASYILSDGLCSELVQVASVLKNASGYYAKLAAPIANTYTSNLKLYRTTKKPCGKGKIVWNGAEFKGVRANINRTVGLENYFDIQGDGIFDGEYFTLEA